MKKSWHILTLLACLAAVVLFAACTKDGNTDETGDGTGTQAGTTAGTTAETEAVTHAPRYDYMDAEVAPDVTIDPSVYTDMKLTLPSSLKVTDQDVVDYIEKIRYQYRASDNGTEKMTGKPLKMGDSAFIFYRGTINGVAFEGGSYWDKDDKNWSEDAPHELGIGSGAFIDGFEEGLIGVIPANTSRENPARVTVTFPENYGKEELNGKEAVFEVYVKYAVQYTIPEYTVDFIDKTLQYEWQKDFYASDKARKAEFEEYVRKSLEAKRAESVDQAKVDALWNYLTEKSECRNLPQLELDFYFNSYKEEIEYYYDSYCQSGGDAFKKEYPDLATFAVAYLGLDKGEDWEVAIRKMAENLVRKDMITHAIAELEGIESVSDEEYKAELDYWVDYYYGYMTEAEVEKNMGKVFLVETAFANKMKTWLLDHATFTYEDDAATPEESTAEEGTTEEPADATGETAAN